MNQSLYLPLTVKAARVIPGSKASDGVRRLGVDFSDRKSKSYMAYSLFVKMIDELNEIGVLK
jgi:hypothetical protein